MKDPATAIKLIKLLEPVNTEIVKAAQLMSPLADKVGLEQPFNDEANRIIRHLDSASRNIREAVSLQRKSLK